MCGIISLRSDYLVYTNEVLGNIWQSYNIPLMSAHLSHDHPIAYTFQKRLTQSCRGSEYEVFEVNGFSSRFLLIPAAGYFLVNNHYKT